ncbi:hypothetical protein BD780_003779 [Clostridium tetanomorphum]|uniref:Uncharacterized protein n=1 Tax=Clostridium tetanomorphum TaxID=1553 RepID=A0A923EC03_CLOTT|nr:hypothetical protein [Clostridium tetanomorphum]KAJ52190.1 hypothetical protein CTM_09011 [Clostridium tetanomorphum DSM 665]MBC2398961.1 hypothetical protein [Clostridium tetanomorphum]MBP1866377.1 hypothetical protein [Clostridium tetanomorphum]NRS86554.1 hypothetical protein [Clostridium tetanomorphum]NRZ95419.1 hypothetical protein [Clostridium tetanomorphum]
MEYYGLSQPKMFSNRNIFIDIKAEYEGLCNTFINPEIRPSLQGIKIFIENKKINGMEERYLHSISLKDKGYHQKILPCTNDIGSIKCIPQCNINNANFIFQKLNRVECYYRLSRIHWIPEIIKYANNNNANTKIWRYDSKDGMGKWYWSRYVRYQSGIVDYLIVFNELYDKKDKTKLNYLDFRTAYPVFLPGDKKKMDKEYNKYIKSIK